MNEVQIEPNPFFIRPPDDWTDLTEEQKLAWALAVVDRLRQGSGK